MKITTFKILLSGFMFYAQLALGQGDVSTRTNKISPALFTNEDGRSAIGFEFNYRREFGAPKAGNSQAGAPVLPPKDIAIRTFVSAEGAISLNNDVRPKKIITLQSGGQLNFDNGCLGSADFCQLSAGVLHETNQDFDQSRTGGTIQSQLDFSRLVNLNLAALLIGADYILTSDKDERTKLVKDDDYWRARLGITLGKTFMVDAQDLLISWNYRYFNELDAPFAVENESLDTYRLSTVMIQTMNPNGRDLFLSYSTGKLPFDHAKDRVYAVGLQFSFE